MAFRLALFVVAVALLHVDARKISRRNDVPPGGWRLVDTTQIPTEVQSHAKEELLSQLQSDKGIRYVEIVRAEVQVVAGKNYRLVILFHVTECPASASSAEVSDPDTCPTEEFITCTIEVFHQPWTETIDTQSVSCVR